MKRRKKNPADGKGPAAGCKEGKETEREEIVSPPWRMVLGYPENLKSILIFYKYFVNLCPGSAFFRRVSGNAAMVKPCSDPRRGLPERVWRRRILLRGSSCEKTRRGTLPQTAQN